MKIRIVFTGTDRPNLFTHSDAVPTEGDFLHLEDDPVAYLVTGLSWHGSARESEPCGKLHEVSLYLQEVR